MSSGLRTIVEERGERYDPRLAGVVAIIGFEVAGAGTCHVRIDDGRVAIGEGPAVAEADVTVFCDEPELVGLLDGTATLLTAVLRGDVEVTGDLALALRFHGLPAGQPAAAPARDQERRP